MRRSKAEVLHAHGSIVLGAAARLAAWRTDRPVVLELYGRAPSLPWGVPCPWNVMVARWPGQVVRLRERLRIQPLLIPHGFPEEAVGLRPHAGSRRGTLLYGAQPQLEGRPAPIREITRPRAFARAASRAELVLFGPYGVEAPPELASALALCPSVVGPRDGGYGHLGVRDLYEGAESGSMQTAIQRALDRPAGPRPELERTRRWRLVAEAYFEVYEGCLAPEPWTRRLVARADRWLRKQL